MSAYTIRYQACGSSQPLKGDGSVSDVRTRPTSFFDAFLDGESMDVNDQIEAWHDSGEEEQRSLAEYLGVTEDEYDIWLMDARTLPLIARARQAGAPSLQALVTERVRQMAASPGPDDSSALFAMRNWLAARGA
jgi:hypothetical protein